jgi:hypothetical protein
MGKLVSEGAICSGVRASGSPYPVVIRAQNLIKVIQGHHRFLHTSRNNAQFDEMWLLNLSGINLSSFVTSSNMLPAIHIARPFESKTVRDAAQQLTAGSTPDCLIFASCAGQITLRRQHEVGGRDLGTILAGSHKAPQAQRIVRLGDIVQAGVADPALLVGLDSEAGVDLCAIGGDDYH